MPQKQAKKQAQRKSKAKNKNTNGATNRNRVKTLSVPAARGFATTAMRPSVSPVSDGIRIKHREYFWPTVGGLGATFNIWRQPSTGLAPRINPANDFLFPWLSNLAVCYERYTFHKLTFGYMPRCSTNTTGVIIIGIEPDPLDDPPPTESVLLSYKSVVDGPVWAELKTSLSTADLHGSQVKKYVTRVRDAEPRSSDCGSFLYYGDGPAASGKFYVDYDVSFFTPQLPASGTTGAGLVVDFAPTATEIFGLEPSIYTKGINFKKEPTANRFSFDGLSVGDLIEIAWSWQNNNASSKTMSSTWGISGLAATNSASPVDVIAGATGSLVKQFSVTTPSGYFDVPLPVGSTVPTFHSNLLATVLPYTSHPW